MRSLYECYLENGLDLKISFGAWSESAKLSDEFFAKTFAGDGCKRHPKFFNICEYADCHRFESNCLPVSDVLVVLKANRTATGGKVRYSRLYDGRYARTLIRSHPQVKMRTKFAVIEGDGLELVTDGGATLDLHNTLWKERFEEDEYGLSPENYSTCMSSAVLACVPHHSSWLHPSGGLANILRSSRAGGKADNSFLLVAHKKDDCRKDGSRLHSYMYLFHKSGTGEKVDVVLIAPAYQGDGSTVFQCVLLKSPEDCRIKLDYFAASKRSCGTHASDGNREFEESTRKAKRARLDCKAKKRPERPDFPCSCDLCVQSFDSSLYGRSVRDEGPQIRMACQLDSFDWLDLFGINTAENREMLLRAFDLSTAGYDIESTTEGVGDVFGGTRLAEEVLEVVSKFKAASVQVARQKCSLIGYGDSFSLGEGWHYRRFESVDDFYSHLRERQKTLYRLKMQILQPLTDQIKKYFQVYYDYTYDKGTGDFPPCGTGESPDFEDYDDNGRSDSTADLFREFINTRFRLGQNHRGNLDSVHDRAFKVARNSMPGKFLQHLHNKCFELRVFGFNSSSYDNVLVVNDLIKAYKTRCRNKSGLALRKRGGKIRFMGIKSEGIYFHDVKEMLAPSSSLSKFAQMTNLEERKMAFPFGLFTHKSFLRRKRLPAASEVWFDVLRQEAPSQEQVDEVQRDFDRLGCANVGEYLDHYLKSEYSFC